MQTLYPSCFSNYAGTDCDMYESKCVHMKECEEKLYEKIKEMIKK